MILPEGREVRRVRVGRCLTPTRGRVPLSLEAKATVGAMGLGGGGGCGIVECVT